MDFIDNKGVGDNSCRAKVPVMNGIESPSKDGYVHECMATSDDRNL